MPKAVLEKAVNGGGRQPPLGRDGLYAGGLGHIDGMCEAFREGWLHAGRLGEGELSGIPFTLTP